MASQRARKEVPSARPNHKITNFFPVKTPTSSQSSSSSQSAVKKTKSSEVKAGSQVEPPRVVESKTSSKTSQSFTSSFSSPPAPLALPGSGSANAQPVRALEQSLSHSTAIKEPGLSSGTARPSKRTQSAMEEESHENSDDVIVRPSPPKQPRIDSSQSEVKATPTKKIQSKTSAANATNPPAVRRPLTPYHATSEPMAFIDPSIPHSTPLTGSEEIGQAETIASPRLLESKRSAIDVMQVDAVVPSSQEDEKEFSRVPAMTSRPKAMDDSFVINSPAPSTSSTTSSSTPEAHPVFSSGQASDRKSVSSAASSVPSLGAPSPLIDHHEHARRKIEEMKARISEKAKAAIKVENPSKTPNLEESSDEELLSPFEKNRDSNPQPALSLSQLSPLTDLSDDEDEDEDEALDGRRSPSPSYRRHTSRLHPARTTGRPARASASKSSEIEMPSLPPKKCRSSRANDSFLTLLKDHRRDEKLSHERRQFSLSSSDSDDEDLDGLYSSGTSAKDNLEALVGKEDAQGMRQILEQDGQTCTDDDELHGFTFWDRGAPGTGHIHVKAPNAALIGAFPIFESISRHLSGNKNRDAALLLQSEDMLCDDSAQYSDLIVWLYDSAIFSNAVAVANASLNCLHDLVSRVTLSKPCLSFLDLVTAVQEIGASANILLSEGWYSDELTPPDVSYESQQSLVRRLLSTLQPLIRMGALNLAQGGDVCILMAYVALDSAASLSIRQKTSDILHDVLKRIMGTSAFLKTEEVHLIQRVAKWLKKLSHTLQREALLLFTSSVSPATGLGQWLAWSILYNGDVNYDAPRRPSLEDAKMLLYTVEGNIARSRLFRIKSTTDYTVLHHHIYVLNLYLTNIEDYYTSPEVQPLGGPGPSVNPTPTSSTSADAELQLIIQGLKQMDTAIRDRDTSNLQRTIAKDGLNRLLFRLTYQKDGAMSHLASRRSASGLDRYVTVRPKQTAQRTAAPTASP